MLERDAAGDSHDFGCVMLYLPDEMADAVLEWGAENVPEEWLTGDGREDQPHCTLLYGLLPDLELEDIEEFLPESAIEVTLGKVSRFDTHEDYDVIKIEVEGDALVEAHLRLAEAPNKDPHADAYKPHVTIAYVKKGKGKELDGQRPFDGLELDLDDLVWSPGRRGRRPQDAHQPRAREGRGWQDGLALGAVDEEVGGNNGNHARAVAGDGVVPGGRQARHRRQARGQGGPRSGRGRLGLLAPVRRGRRKGLLERPLGHDLLGPQLRQEVASPLA